MKKITMCTILIFLLQMNFAHANERIKMISMNNQIDIYPPSLGEPGYYTLIVYTTKWCGPCKVLKEQYPYLIKNFSNLFIKHLEYSVDLPQGLRIFLRGRLGLLSYPAYLLLNPQGFPTYSGYSPDIRRLIQKLKNRRYFKPLPLIGIQDAHKKTNKKEVTSINDQKSTLYNIPQKPKESISSTVLAVTMTASAILLTIGIAIIINAYNNNNEKKEEIQANQDRGFNPFKRK